MREKQDFWQVTKFFLREKIGSGKKSPTQRVGGRSEAGVSRNWVVKVYLGNVAYSQRCLPASSGTIDLSRFVPLLAGKQCLCATRATRNRECRGDFVTASNEKIMRIFVYEYTCAALAWSSLPESLRQEGWAMLSAVVEDFARWPDAVPLTLLADDFPGRLTENDQRCSGNEQQAFLILAGEADWTLVIAPEFNELLERRCQWAKQAGGRLLNASEEALRLTADKWRLNKHFHKHQVPTSEMLSKFDLKEIRGGDQIETLSGLSFPSVLKPRWGAGSQATFFINTKEELIQAIEKTRQEGSFSEFIITCFVPGKPVSVAFLMGPGQCLPLLPCEQHLSQDGLLQFLGGRLPLEEPLTRRVVSLAQKAVKTVPGFLGYIGVDLILVEDEMGSQDRVIEINPRLTTSYIGLRRLAQCNLAQAMTQMAEGQETTIQWDRGNILFGVDGAVNRVGG